MRIDAPREIAQRDERSLRVAFLDQMLDGAGADILQCRERIEHGIVLHREIDLGCVDRRRHDPDPDALGLLAEDLQFVRIAHIERHRGGEEFHRMVGLEIGRLIADIGVRGGVRFVEAVFGEFGTSIEDIDGDG